MIETRFIPVARPTLGDEEAAAAREAILSGWVTQGPQVLAFEREFADYVGSRHACAASSCTTAMHLALLAVGVTPGDEVIVPSHSFVATANSIRYCGAVPVFVDIEPETFNISPNAIESAINASTRALLVVHQMGMPCDMRRVLDVANAHGLAVVEDAACAIGSEVFWNDEWQPIGRALGRVVCFSFHPRKILTTGDGGMITTNDADIDAKVRRWRQHSMSVSDTARHAAQTVVFEEYVDFSYNYRLTDIQAAIGRVQLRRLPALLARRRELAAGYAARLRASGVVDPPREPEWARSNWQSYCVRLPDAGRQRLVMQRLLDEGIASRRGIMCAHRERSYPRDAWRCAACYPACGCEGSSCALLCESERARDSTIILPLYHEMTDVDQDRVVDALGRAVLY